jgi:transposase
MTTNNRNATQSHRDCPNSGEMPKEVEKAYHYHLRGLTAKEVAKLLGKAPRTVQRWAKDYNFEQLEAIPAPELETIPQKALRMAKAGLSYSQIAKKLRRCKATIYNYIKAENAKTANAYLDNSK